MIINNIGVLAAAVRKSITDTFTRANSSNINPATDGSVWTILRGVWTISGNRATTTTAASEKPLIIQEIPFENVDILQKSPQIGTSTALWVSDANNWWAVGVDASSVNCNCVTSDCCGAYGCTTTGCTGTGCTGYGCIATGCTSEGCTGTGCTGWGCNGYYYYSTPDVCVGYTCTRYRWVDSANRLVCVEATCTSWRYGISGYACTYGCTTYGCNQYGCNTYGCTTEGCTGTGCTTFGCTGLGCTSMTTCTTCQTCYPKYLRVIQSAANVISTTASWLIGDVVLGSFRVKTLGKQITAQAYSDVNGVVRQGSEFSTTQESATPTNKFGLTISPTQFLQGNSSGGININSNQQV